MKIFNQIQLAVILALVVLGIFAFTSQYYLRKSGAVVVSVVNFGCNNVNVGDVITEAGGNQIQSAQDFNSLRFQSQQFVSIVVNSGPGGCIALSDGTLGVSIKDTTAASLLFGSDLIGGKEFTLSSIPGSSLQNTANILKIRASYLGIVGMKIQNDNGVLKITAPANQNVNQILFPGYFEGDVEEQIILSNENGSFFVGDNSFAILRNGNDFLVNNRTYNLNGSFLVNDITVRIVNQTNNSVILAFEIYNNTDVVGEVPGYAQTVYNSNNGAYNFNTVIRLSAVAAKRFNEVTKNVKTTVIGTQVTLDAGLANSLDGNRLGTLSIPITLKGQDLSNVLITVGDSSKQSLANKAKILEATINSGYVPYNLKIANTQDTAATQSIFILPLLGIIVLTLALSPVLLATKYKKFKHNSLSIAIGSAEVFAVVSIFAALQIYSGLNYVFDFAALISLVLLSMNWMLNVISLNLSSHAQKNLVIRIKYKNIISLTGLSKLLLFAVAIGFAASNYQSATIIIFAGIILDLLLFKSFYKSFIS